MLVGDFFKKKLGKQFGIVTDRRVLTQMILILASLNPVGISLKRMWCR